MTSNNNSELKKILDEYRQFDLKSIMPECNSSRILIDQGQLKLKDPTKQLSDVYCFLFTDMLLITVKKKDRKNTGKQIYKIIRPPIPTNRIVVRELSDSDKAFAVLHLNTYGTCDFVYLFTNPMYKKWIESIEYAQKMYINEINEFKKTINTKDLFEKNIQTDDPVDLNESNITVDTEKQQQIENESSLKRPQYTQNKSRKNHKIDRKTRYFTDPQTVMQRKPPTDDESITKISKRNSLHDKLDQNQIQKQLNKQVYGDSTSTILSNDSGVGSTLYGLNNQSNSIESIKYNKLSEEESFDIEQKFLRNDKNFNNSSIFRQNLKDLKILNKKNFFSLDESASRDKTNCYSYPQYNATEANQDLDQNHYEHLNEFDSKQENDSDNKFRTHSTSNNSSLRRYGGEIRRSATPIDYLINQTYDTNQSIANDSFRENKNVFVNLYASNPNDVT